jgi:hypothetical protein
MIQKMLIKHLGKHDALNLLQEFFFLQDDLPFFLEYNFVFMMNIVFAYRSLIEALSELK